ncbi:glycoside hydrolase family 13 protein [Alteromonas facilis]|uniref:glycoside hydrolase family 13 protein n=1 Tax=Alteromonas facilis TaxID=2048004 RepID=UPI0013DB148D|nr:glycoside hydrolase family 13 protein [Alteromonas facilis]
MTSLRIPLICAAGLLLSACSQQVPDTSIKQSPNNTPPEWAKSAVWYQIFVERFNNGDKGNDPTIADLQGGYPGYIPDDWQVSDWTSDWYAPDPYFASVHGQLDSSGYPIEKFSTKTSLRRYGGDLQGVINKLDYLASLGVNALYFNPLNDSPSLHKFDARHWRHIDVNFGPDPEGDKALIAKEDPSDPNTWVMTSADKLFVELIQHAKQRGMRVILDYSWNHTGNTFWAWQDVVENQQQSKYADWYWVDRFDDPETPENEFAFHGWFGVKQMPEIRETVKVDHSNGIAVFEGDIASQQVKDHIFAVTKRWLDPNGDGDPSDGIDGYRLDVAAEVPLGFWREYREFVRSVNPEAYLIGEIWWEQWPKTLIDPANVLQGDVFDAVMNYRWYRSARRYFAGIDNSILPSQLVTELDELTEGYDRAHLLAMMNMSASHDTPRVLTSFYNKNNYKFNTTADADPTYKIGKPDGETYARVKAFLTFQFTQPGAPQIYAGDEMGMWGSDDPHNRKPLIWPELTFDNETLHPLGHERASDPVKFNTDLFTVYQSLIALRETNPVLVDGAIEYYATKDEQNVLAYARSNEQGQRVYVAFNMSAVEQVFPMPQNLLTDRPAQLWQSDSPILEKANLQQPVMIAPMSAAVIVL